MSKTPPSAAIIGPRFSRSLYVGRHRTARGIAVSSRDAQDVASQRRARGPARPPRRPLGDPRGGVVQGHRVPAGGGAHSGVAVADRRARARREGEGASGDREDDREQGRRSRRGRRDARAHEAPRARPGRRRRLPAASRGRAQDCRTDLDAARHHVARRPEDWQQSRAGCATSPGWERGARRRS